MKCTLALVAAFALVPRTACLADENVLDLAAAEPLAVESLCVPVKTMRLYQKATVPHRDGKGYDLLLFYYDFRSGLACQAVIVDLVTGEVLQLAPTPRGAPWRFALGRDGKLYMGHYGSAAVWIYDPDSKEMQFVESDISDVGTVSSIACGTDGKIYCGTTPKVKSFQYDPATGRFTDYGIQGPVRKYLGYGYTIGADDDFVYTASGKIPWYIVAYNKQTGKQEWHVKGDPADYVCVRQQRFGCTGLHLIRSGKAVNRRVEYWLHKGKAILKEVGDKPPWQEPETQKPSLAPKPELFLDLASPGSDGWAEVWWRAPWAQARQTTDAAPSDRGKPAWRQVRFQLKVSPAKIRRIKEMPDGRLIGSSSNYQDFFTVDPTTGKCATLGKIPLSHYATCFAGGKVYFVGYPSTPVYEYDPGKPWTPGHGTPQRPAPPVDKPGSNPRRLCYLAQQVFTHHGKAAVAGADGRIYVGGHAERSHVGGGLGWWDPKTQTPGGIREPFEQFDIAGLAAINEGWKIVYSSRVVRDPTTQKTPESAKLFVYDVRSAKIVSELAPLPGRSSTGKILAVGDGLITGVAPGAQRDRCTLYLADMRSGEVVKQRDLPDPQKGAFRVGPDGHVWTFLSDVLIRVHPQTLRTTVVGRLANPGHFAFAGRDLYFAGQAELRCVRAVVP